MPHKISTMRLLLATLLGACVHGSGCENHTDIHRDFRKTALSTVLSTIEERADLVTLNKCNEEHDYVLDKVNAAFGEENCSTLLAVDRESTVYNCQTSGEYLVEDMVITFNASAEYTYLPQDPHQKRTLEIRYGDVLMGVKNQVTDFRSYQNCIDDFEDGFSTIRQYTYDGCDDKNTDIMKALHAAFGEENCYHNPDYTLDGEHYASYGCSIRFGSYSEYLDARAEYEYLPDDNDKPYYLRVSFTTDDNSGVCGPCNPCDSDDKCNPCDSDDKSTDFSATCLDDLTNNLAFIERRTISYFKNEGKCQEAHGYVRTAMDVTFGEEHCSTLSLAGSDSETYSCHFTVEEFETTAVYDYFRNSEFEPRSLQIQYGGIGMGMRSLVIDFTTTCLYESQWKDASKIIRGYTFDGCNEEHADVMAKLIDIFGERNCDEWSMPYVKYGTDYGSQNRRFFRCQRNVRSFIAYADYEFDDVHDKNSPRTLHITYPSGEKISTDLSTSEGCFSDFQDVFGSIDKGFKCTNNELTPFQYRRVNGKIIQSTCEGIGKRGKPRMLKWLCKRNVNVIEQCPGLCKIQDECKCYNNPYAFKINRKQKITCNALMTMSVAERKNACNKKKIKRNCPEICKQSCPSSVWNEPWSELSEAPYSSPSSSPCSIPVAYGYRIRGITFPGTLAWDLAWDVRELYLYTDDNCGRGTRITSGTPISSGYYPSSNLAPDSAFDNDSTSIWGGRPDASGAFFLGLNFASPTAIRCLRFIEAEPWPTTGFIVEFNDGDNWLPVNGMYPVSKSKNILDFTYQVCG